jgi:hypothetical protein
MLREGQQRRERLHRLSRIGCQEEAFGLALLAESVSTQILSADIGWLMALDKDGAPLGEHDLTRVGGQHDLLGV